MFGLLQSLSFSLKKKLQESNLCGSLAEIRRGVMFRSSTASVLPIFRSQSTEQLKSSKYNWKTLTKAGLVFATTTGAFCVLKATGSFNLVSSWLRSTKTNLNEQETGLAAREVTGGIKAYSEHLDLKELPLTTVKDSQHIAFMPQRTKRNPTETLEKIGSEFRVNTYTTNNQRYPSVAGLSDGKFVVTWGSLGQDGSDYGVYGQMYNADGSKYSSEFQVNTYTTNYQWYPSVVSLSDGKFVVTWQSSGQDGSYYGIYGQMYNADGNKYSSEFRVNTYTTNDQLCPSVAGLSNGKFVVTWESSGQDGDLYGIYGQMYNADASKYSSEFRVNTYAANTQRYPSVASLSDGKFVVTWESLDQDGSYYGIYGQMYNADGSKYSSEFQVNTYTTSYQSAPSVAGLNDGKFVVTWSSDGQDGSGYGVYGQMYNTDASKYSSEFRVNTYTTSYQSAPSVAGLNDGKFVVTWESLGQDGDLYGIYGQMFYADGSKYSSEFRVNTYTTSHQSAPSVAGLSDGKFVVTWGSSGQDGDHDGIYGQMFSVNETIASSYVSSNQQISESSSTISSVFTVSSSKSSSTIMPTSSIKSSPYLSSSSQQSVSSMKKSSSSTSSIESISSPKQISTSSEVVTKSDSYSPTKSEITNESSSSGTVSSNPSISQSTTLSKVSTSAFFDSSKSTATSTGKSLLATIMGLVGGVVSTIGTIFGMWLKYKKYRAIIKLRQQSPLAAEVQKYLNLDVSDFQSKLGQKYVAVINGIVEALQKQGTPVDEMDKEQLHDLTLSSVEVIKKEVEPNKTFLRKTIPVKGLKNARDSIIKGVINKYVKGKNKNGIMLQSIKSEEADIEENVYESGGKLFGVKDIQRIQLKDLNSEGKIGDGSFGDVYKAKWQGNDVAVKILKEGIVDLPEFVGDFIREAATWSKLTHPNITRFYGICWTKPSPYIVVEYVGGGSLASHLKKKDLSLVQRLGLGLDTVRGVKYLHEYNPPIWHRDIKPDNVLVEYAWNQSNEQWLPRGKVTDFGTARQKIFNRTEMALTKGVGTPLYQAPEIIKGSKDYSEKADIYSIGICLCEVYTQKEPYSDQPDLSNQFKFFKAITEKKIRPTIPEEMPKSYAVLIKQCWSERSNKRPNAAEVEQRLKPIVDEVAQECTANP
jgi:hypothetical protein